MKIRVSLYYHLKEKTGLGNMELDVQENSSIREVKNILESQFPSLRTHLDNVMVLMDRKVVLDEDKIKEDAEISFLTPIGGG